MNIKNLLIICLLFMSFVFAENGMFDLDFLGSSSRMIALGGVSAVDNKGIESVFGNPGAIHDASQIRMGAMQTQLIGDVNYQVFGVTMTDLLGFSVGFGLQRIGVQDICFTGQEGNGTIFVADTFGFVQTKAKIGINKNVGQFLAMGVSIGFEQVDAETYAKGNGYSLDAGLEISFWDWVRLGVIANNVTSALNWETGSQETFTPSMVYGARITLEELRILVQVEQEGCRPMLTKLGLSYVLFNTIELRAGYFPQNSDEGTLTLGTGINLGMINVDYAYKVEGQYGQNSMHVMSAWFGL